jgi:hypothetical protein
VPSLFQRLSWYRPSLPLLALAAVVLTFGWAGFALTYESYGLADKEAAALTGLAAALFVLVISVPRAPDLKSRFIDAVAVGAATALGVWLIGLVTLVVLLLGPYSLA